ncbi:MAG TPA: divalent-cation tolerance protein CutA [Methanospirillum sp.]|uniref:divalent-cation tolerance protein CutA n=1 Tax=Methanospirillum sp. TaxID=45200 RepID=UPI002CF0DFB6|nr:divalent-cation tolerance protein CutA [Methanospirillum sp.]HOJ95890.1 divalent-cation tolerance protein CutA [Methanospirillum sp.]HPP78529.1 divalent-cation tolerance protein CutA [Methanospirillum sp.]
MQEQNSDQVVVVLCTAPPGIAHTMATRLLDKKLVACINILPARSVYRWQGAVCDEPEDLLFMKTTRGNVHDLTKFLVDIHPYDIPEVLVVPVQDGYDRYLSWVVSEVQKKP